MVHSQYPLKISGQETFKMFLNPTNVGPTFQIAILLVSQQAGYNKDLYL